MKFYQKTWFIVLSLFFFAPLGLFLMWRYKPTWGKLTKGVLTGFFCIWFIGMLIGTFSDTPAEPASDIPIQSVSESKAESKAETTPQSFTTSATEKTTDEPTTEVSTTASTSGVASKAAADGSAQAGVQTNGNATAKGTGKSTGQASKKQTGGQSSNQSSGTKTTTTKNRTKETTTLDPDAQVTVYITKTGKRYHHENPCGNGTYYPVSLAEAKSRGYTPCEKCVLH